MRNEEPEYNNPLRRIRESRRLSAIELARRAGTSQSQITRLENDGMPGADAQNSRELTKRWAMKLAPHLDCSWEELLAGHEFTDDERNHIVHYRMLSPEQQKELSLLAVLMVRDHDAISKMFAYGVRLVHKIKAQHNTAPDTDRTKSDKEIA